MQTISSPGIQTTGGDIYVYDRETGAMERLSLRPDGSQFPGESKTGSGGAISTDGSLAVFSAAFDEGGETQTWLRERNLVTPGADPADRKPDSEPAQPAVGSAVRK